MLDHAKRFASPQKLVNEIVRTILTREVRIILYDNNGGIVDICESDVEPGKDSYGVITAKGRRPTGWLKRWLKGRENSRIYFSPVDRGRHD